MGTVRANQRPTTWLDYFYFKLTLNRFVELLVKSVKFDREGNFLFVLLLILEIYTKIY